MKRDDLISWLIKYCTGSKYAKLPIFCFAFTCQDALGCQQLGI